MKKTEMKVEEREEERETDQRRRVRGLKNSVTLAIVQRGVTDITATVQWSEDATTTHTTLQVGLLITTMACTRRWIEAQANTMADTGGLEDMDTGTGTETRPNIQGDTSIKLVIATIMKEAGLLLVLDQDPR